MTTVWEEELCEEGEEERTTRYDVGGGDSVVISLVNAAAIAVRKPNAFGVSSILCTYVTIAPLSFVFSFARSFASSPANSLSTSSARPVIFFLSSITCCTLSGT